MILSRDQIEKYKICIDCMNIADNRGDAVDCDNCEHVEISRMKAVDLCETLEHVWNELKFQIGIKQELQDILEEYD